MTDSTPVPTPTPAAGPPARTRGGMQPYVWSLCGCLWFAVMGLITHDLGRPIDDAGTPSCPWTVVCFVRSVVRHGLRRVAGSRYRGQARGVLVAQPVGA